MSELSRARGAGKPVQTEDLTEPRPISGRVTELRESGQVKVKTGTRRNSPAYLVQVPPEDLIAMRLSFGDAVNFLVEEVQGPIASGL